MIGVRRYVRSYDVDRSQEGLPELGYTTGVISSIRSRAYDQSRAYDRSRDISVL
jgi:hypothetical protein